MILKLLLGIFGTRGSPILFILRCWLQQHKWLLAGTLHTRSQVNYGVEWGQNSSHLIGPWNSNKCTNPHANLLPHWAPINKTRPRVKLVHNKRWTKKNTSSCKYHIFDGVDSLECCSVRKKKWQFEIFSFSQVATLSFHTADWPIYQWIIKKNSFGG